MAGKLRICVGIPTLGRAGVLLRTLKELNRQNRAPDTVIVCGTQPADFEGAISVRPGTVLLLAPAGLPRQRNAIVAAAGDADALVFFDDDFLPHPDYLSVVEEHMAENPETIAATGRVVADGINGPGLSAAEAVNLLAQPCHPGVADQPIFSAYGCNMAIRLGPVRRYDLSFDERLPLYGWQEDVDMSRQLATYGKIVQLHAARGVHLGTKLGRGSGVRLGYSQVANPIYLAGKRRGYPLGRALSHITCNIAMNIVRSPWPEPYVDRRGRLRGNALAIRDFLSGRMLPERVLDF
ncbi:MAG TPA: glycosyltransferase [Acetobacteraceae bacterium]|nr:glycosyltransferase [Acetobacteraceae bacterium]